MRFLLIMLAASLVGTVAAQAQQPQSNPSQSVLSDDEKKPQQNAADEAGVRGRLEDGVRPGPPEEQGKANKKVEDAAVEAKQKSDAKQKTK